MLSSALVCISILAYAMRLLYTQWKTKRLSLPPGPPADIVIGHARFLPLEYPWKCFAEWGKKWGGLLYIHILGNPMIIVNDLKIARELMEKRGAIYSDRPRCVMHCDLLGWGNILGFLPYGDRFRKQRRMIQQHFNAQAVVNFHPLQRREVGTLLVNLLDSPEDFPRHIFRAIAATVTMATFGRHVISDNDEYVRLIEKVNTFTSDAGPPGTTLVDVLPILRYLPSWFPGANFKRWALNARTSVEEARSMPFNSVKAERASGIAQPSFVCSLFDEYERNGEISEEDEEDIKAVSGNIYSAAVETTLSTLLAFVLAMVHHPSIAKRARFEIDSVTGQNRLPTFQDREDLPYVTCILKECLRWTPSIALGLPHRSTADDDFEGMHIPSGSTIVPNIWYFMQNEKHFPGPQCFNPERFLNGSCAEDYDPLNVVFGFGRRICPGRFFAESELWITMANMLAAFDFKPPVDSIGREYLPEVGFTTGMSSRPKDFRCRIVPRNERYIELIRQTVSD